MMFVQWLFSMIGIPLAIKSASCSEVARWYKKNKPDCVLIEPKVGCIVIYEWGHTGIVIDVKPNKIITIEGNTSSSNSGSQANGDGVYQRERPKAETNIYIDVINEDDDDMTQEQFNKMFNEAIKAYRQDLQDNDSGNYSQEGRAWAINNGIIQGGNPLPDGQPNYMWQDFLTREQFVTMLSRYDKKKK